MMLISNLLLGAEFFLRS